MGQVFYIDGTPSRETAEDDGDMTKGDRLRASLELVESIETLGSTAGDNALFDAARALRLALDLCKS